MRFIHSLYNGALLFGTATWCFNLNEKQREVAGEKIWTEQKATVNWSKMYNE